MAMKFFDRLTTLIKADAHGVVDALEERSLLLRQHVREAELESFDGVVAAGGDGTVFEVVNGYFQNPATGRPPFGVIPIGTGNAPSSKAASVSFRLTDAERACLPLRPRLMDPVDLPASLARSFAGIGVSRATDLWVVNSQSCGKW